MARASELFHFPHNNSQRNEGGERGKGAPFLGVSHIASQLMCIIDVLAHFVPSSFSPWNAHPPRECYRTRYSRRSHFIKRGPANARSEWLSVFLENNY